MTSLSPPATPTRLFLTGLFGVAGVMHFRSPEHFDRIVPRALPGNPRTYTYASGVAELAVAGMLSLPRTRRWGGVAAAALLIAVFPANVQMALDWDRKDTRKRAIGWGRLPLQGVLIAQAARVARRG